MSIQHFPNKVSITKYSIVTNSNSVTLRLMTEHDLCDALGVAKSISVSSSGWGGEEARPTLADVQEQYLPSVLAQESGHSIHCNVE